MTLRIFALLLATTCMASCASEPAPVSDKSATLELVVSGNCDMCKARIEQAANGVAGASNASWDASTQTLSVALDTSTNLSAVATAVAASGHDNAMHTSSSSVYDALPECCQYTRQTP